LVSHTEKGTEAEGVRIRVFRNIFKFKRDEVTRKRRRLHNEELFMICTPHQVLFG
jgi:hypothetical protein